MQTLSAVKRVSCAGALLALAVACGGDPSPAGPAREHRVILGTGEASFEAMDGEPRLTLVAGSQGGFHVWASFQAYGFDDPQVDLVVITSLQDQPDTRLVMRAQISSQQATDEAGEPLHTFAGFPAQIRNARCAQDERVLIELTVSDANGSATDTRSCIADIDPMYRSDNCE